MTERSGLLDALRPQDRDLLLARATDVRFGTGQVIFDPGNLVDFCYLPRGSAIVSYGIILESGTVVEALMVGREGALGALVSGEPSPAYARLSVAHGGNFHWIALADLDRVKEASPSVRSLFSRYADCLLAQVVQSIACNATHTIEQRAAKWLLAAAERTGGTQITMTQEQLASMMGIGRSYASRVVQRFKLEGLLRTRRGGVEVVAPDGLEQRACSCNRMVQSHFAQVLSGLYSPR